MSFTRKYRPESLDSYVGNEIIKKRIFSALNREELPQSIIFQGDRGCGKTTMARILGKAILCLDKKEDGTPCEQCKNCQDITKDYIATGKRVSGIPIYEINVTEEGRKDNVLELIKDMKTRPIGKNTKKIYILDEIQTMNHQAQASLLKITEEPDPWLHIILCTTDPEDLIVPLRSRLTKFEIKRPSIKEISKRLIYICEQENIPYDPKAVDLLVKLSNRIPRESIKNLEDVAGYGDITYKNVQDTLQVTKVEVFIEYINLFNKDIFTTLDFLDKLHEEHDVEPGDFLKGLSDFVIDAFNMKNGVGIDRYTEEEYKATRVAFKHMDIQTMIRFIELIGEAIKLRENPRHALYQLTLEMAHPEYFERRITHDEVKAMLKKEETTSIRKYKDNKQKLESSKRGEEDVLTQDALQELFPDSFLVEDMDLGDGE